jgi:hypothetical protein
MTKMQTILTYDDFDFIIVELNNASLEIKDEQEAKQETMYDIIEAKIRGVQQSLQSNRTVSTVPLSSGEQELGDEPSQLHRLADTIEACLRRA